tara:strand:- start:988 stop:1191 length:204 start_codon:yes stop_codon:yes gene_type:complete
MALFDYTKRTDMDLALARGLGNPFSAETLARIAIQNTGFLKPRVNIPKMQFMAVIPLVIIAFLVLKK